MDVEDAEDATNQNDYCLDVVVQSPDEPLSSNDSQHNIAYENINITTPDSPASEEITIFETNANEGEPCDSPIRSGKLQANFPIDFIQVENLLIPKPQFSVEKFNQKSTHNSSNEKNEDIREEIHFKVDLSTTRSSLNVRQWNKKLPTSFKIPQERRAKRPRFSWPCFPSFYVMGEEFDNPNFRSRFVSKILALKTLQWLIVSVWAIGLNNFHEISTWLNHYSILGLYGTTVLYIVLFLTVRSTNLVDNIPIAVCIFVVYTICMTYIFATLYTMFETTIVPQFLLTLVFSYFTISLICLSWQVNIKSGDILMLLVSSMVVFSVFSYAVVAVASHTPGGQPMGEYVGSTWLPALAIAEVLGCHEVTEIQKLLEGLVVPLYRHDWIVATVFLL